MNITMYVRQINTNTKHTSLFRFHEHFVIWNANLGICEDCWWFIPLKSILKNLLWIGFDCMISQFSLVYLRWSGFIEVSVLMCVYTVSEASSDWSAAATLLHPIRTQEEETQWAALHHFLWTSGSSSHHDTFSLWECFTGVLLDVQGSGNGRIVNQTWKICM